MSDISSVLAQAGVVTSEPQVARASATSDAKIANARLILDQQNCLLKELHSFATQTAKTAAALSQAVQLAQDGLVDVTDIHKTAQQLLQTGEIKTSSFGALFDLSAGATSDKVASSSEQLDPLTRTLRELSGAI